MTRQYSPVDRAAFAVSSLILVYGIYSSVHFALQDDVRHLLARVVDDASYYMTIARNIAAGQGLTFDGIHSTNGFHPLWLLLLIPLFRLQGTPETMIRLVVLLQVALSSFTYLVFFRTQSRLFSPPTAALSAILFVYFVFLPNINGMESAVLLSAIVVLYSYGFHVAQSELDGRRAMLLGVILGFVLLARLDMIFIALALLGWGVQYILNRQTRSRAIAMMVICGFATCAVVGPYLAFNYSRFGALVPISGALESSFPHPALNEYTFARIAASGTANLASAALAIGRSLWSIARIQSKRSQPGGEFYGMATTIFAWAITLHFLYEVLFVRWGTFGWHFVAYPLFAIVLLTGAMDRALRWTRVIERPAPYAVTAALLSAGAIVGDQTRDLFPQNGGWHTPVYEAAVWAREHTPPNAIFAMSDCGHFAFFSARRVINLDGIVNNMDFQRTLVQHHLGQYLQENHVDFLVQHAVHNREDVIAGRYNFLELRFPSRRFDGFSDSVSVRAQTEAYRSTRFFDGPYPSVLVIWALRSD